MLDIDTAIGDGAQLGHASSLHPGQTVPAAAELARLPGAAHRRRLPVRRPGPLRRRPAAAFAAVQLVNVLLLAPALTTAGRARAQADAHAPTSSGPGRATPRAFYLDQLALAGHRCCSSAALLLGLLVRRHRAAAAAPALVPGRVYRLYGVRYWVSARRAHDQHPVLHQPLRRQLLHHRLPADDRVPSAAHRPDGLELRRRAHPRDARTCAASARTRWSPTASRWPAPTSPAPRSGPARRRSERTASSATRSPTPRAARSGTTAWSARRP